MMNRLASVFVKIRRAQIIAIVHSGGFKGGGAAGAVSLLAHIFFQKAAFSV